MKTQPWFYILCLFLWMTTSHLPALGQGVQHIVMLADSSGSKIIGLRGETSCLDHIYLGEFQSKTRSIKSPKLKDQLTEHFQPLWEMIQYDAYKNCQGSPIQKIIASGCTLSRKKETVIIAFYFFPTDTSDWGEEIYSYESEDSITQTVEIGPNEPPEKKTSLIVQLTHATQRFLLTGIHGFVLGKVLIFQGKGKKSSLKEELQFKLAEGRIMVKEYVPYYEEEHE